MTQVAVTLGDPTGIGPEITARCLAELDHAAVARLRVFGHPETLAAAAALVGVTLPPGLEVCGPTTPAPLAFGAPDHASGAAQVAYLEAATDALRQGACAGLVTAPISKTWAQRAGFSFPGHTEYLAARLGAGQVTMTFVGPRLKVALATVHLPLAAVPTALTTTGLTETIAQLARALRDDFGLARPRVGVCGLNPHAGEGGLLGDDEQRVVAPAIAAARALGIDARGPLVPDAAFRAHLDGACDGLVALYHDQGLIPVKLIDFDDAVNVTLGLPIVRTSPDHGTAHDIAGRGVARASSMRAALRLALAMVDRRASVHRP
jgi:4-hydroxythreonine-4-phosphate dehydrogenase